MKDGLAWGCKIADGQITVNGWMKPEDAPIHNPKFCLDPTYVTYKNSPDIEELLTGKLVAVERTTTVRLV